MSIREFTYPTIISANQSKIDDFTIDKDTETTTFVIGPFVKGYAQTVGHSLRRSLLSSIPSCGIIYVSIDGITHKFCSSELIKEDILHFIENLKKIRFRLKDNSVNSVMIHVDINEVLERNSASAPSSSFELYSSMLKTTGFIEILNHEYLCTLNLSKVNNKLHSNFNFNFLVERGVGYVGGSVNTDIPYGAIPINISFNAVKRVNMEISQTRYGEFTDYENLIITISTDKSKTPLQALEMAKGILMNHFGSIGSSEFNVLEKKNQKDSQKELLAKALRDIVGMKDATVATLEANKIYTVGQLIQLTAQDLLKISSIGVTKIQTIQEVLAHYGLSLVSSTYE